jgi:hypothetical protein
VTPILRDGRLRFEQCCWIGPEQADNLFGFGHVRVEPGVLVLWQQDDRHAVVNRRHEVVGLRRDDGTGGELVARGVIGITPGVVEAGEAEEAAVFPGDAILHLRPRTAWLPWPLEEGARREDAALEVQRTLEGGLARDALRPCVDHLGADAGILRPGRDEPPAHQGQNAIRLQRHDLLRGPHVGVVWNRQHRLGNPKLAVDALAVNEFVAAAHGVNRPLVRSRGTRDNSLRVA